MRTGPTEAQNDALEKIREIVGDNGWITGKDQAPFLREWRGHFHGIAAAVVCPADTEEVSAVTRICNQATIGVVPQGGNTGLCGGAAPDDSGTQVLLGLRRMNRIRNLDAANYTLTAEAGCVLKNLQHAAASADRLFPLSLAAEGSCMIGGNLATNAGGTNVLRYGNTRDLTLGLEVVLADGRIWHGLSGLRKDNSGYDLKNLFIGSEGTLGVITAATLKLHPKPRQAATALAALPTAEAAIDLLGHLRDSTGDALTGCELMSGVSLSMAVDHIDSCADPFHREHPWYLLVEASSAQSGAHLRDALESSLEEALHIGLVRDAVIAESLQQANALWRIRESIPAGQARHGASIKHDISVPVSRISEFLARATPRLEKEIPGIRICPFGHVGDGNLHYNLSQPAGMAADTFMELMPKCNRIVHDLVHELGGSIAAEHGIGQLKVNEMLRYRDPVESELMRDIKRTLDPKGIMNPGKVIAPP